MNRIQLHDSLMDIITIMSKGNPGAVNCIMKAEVHHLYSVMPHE
jgi:hypothetical protein